MSKAHKILAGNIALQLAVAALATAPAAYARDPLQKGSIELKNMSPAQRMAERKRRQKLAGQMAKQQLKKSR